MPKITFLNTNQTCEVKKGESILEAAIAHDVPLQHACGGFCACTTCHVHVKSGAENLSAIEEDESERIERAASGVSLQSRLGCQSRIHGDVTVEIVDPDL
jgi:2Fe-2S ferredoxin